MKTHSKQLHGMTLLEVIIAITLIAAMGLVIGVSMSNFRSISAEIEEQTYRYQEVRIAMDRMVRELSTAFISAHEPRATNLLRVKTIFSADQRGRGTRIDFTSFSHVRLKADAHESDQNELSYFIADHPEINGRKVLARRMQSRIDDDPTRGGQVQILIDDIKDFELEFLDPRDLLWKDRWDTLGEERGILPVQVKVLITIPNPNPLAREESTPTITLGTRVSLNIQYALNHSLYAE